MKYPHILKAIYETPWAILLDRLAIILAVVHERAAGFTPTLEQIEERLAAGRTEHSVDAAAQRGQRRVEGTVAVLPVTGILTQRGGVDMDTSESFTSVTMLSKAFRTLLADDSVGAIVLEIDSPGGSVFGIQEFAEEIFRARGQKPVLAVANSLAASAAYWIATAAEELAVTPGGEVGSIGVFTAHTDLSKRAEMLGIKMTLISAGKYKVEGNPYEPLGEEALAAIQTRVDEYYDAFTVAVARYRGVKAADVRNGFGQGRVVGAKEAVSLGMADRVATLDEVLAGLVKSRSTSRRSESDGKVQAELARMRLDLHRT